ncbi:MAG TPA: DUF1835 domain-containing protein [Panacibacter sp.]|nr:DUF1835 domain-containing protein [Panacibacter sp.]
MIHIVFQEADIAVLQKAIELDEKLAGDIIHIKDDYAVGPLENLQTPEGWQARRDWWKMLLEFSPYTEQLDMVDDKLTLHKLKEALDTDDTQHAWVWMGQNQHDVCGYYWLMSQLKDYQGRIFVLYLNNLPFINEKGGIFYPTALHEILPKEFLKAKKLSRPITLSEFEVDPDEWKKLCNENGMVRILEGGKKLASKEVTYYDKDVLAAITAEPQKLQKILSTLFSKLKVKTGDVFLVWRMREMINAGALEAQGDWAKGWKEIVLKLAVVTDASNETAEPLTL